MKLKTDNRRVLLRSSRFFFQLQLIHECEDEGERLLFPPSKFVENWVNYDEDDPSE